MHFASSVLEVVIILRQWRFTAVPKAGATWKRLFTNQSRVNYLLSEFHLSKPQLYVSSFLTYKAVVLLILLLLLGRFRVLWLLRLPTIHIIDMYHIEYIKQYLDYNIWLIFICITNVSHSLQHGFNWLNICCIYQICLKLNHAVDL